MAHYRTDWKSLRAHPVVPEWLREGKFGIYTHWGPYSVPACRPNGSWYGFYMYQKGSPQYEHHVKTYGDPARFGYKDFIPMLTGERFDPEEWAEIFAGAGAKFAGPVGEHHDGFCMWETGLTPFHAGAMGPKRDVAGELEKAIRAKGMKYMVALHHAENWRFFPHWVRESDLDDPAAQALYGRPHNLEWEKGIPTEGTWPIWNSQEKPDKAFCDWWLATCKEAIDRFRPDLLWFDFGLEIVPECYRQEMAAYYYNRAEEWGSQVALTYKNRDMAPGSGLIDLELGRFDSMTHHEWLTDTTVDDGEGWCWLFDARYKEPAVLIQYLIDNVSKNGYLLLNVGPKPDGTLPEEAKAILKEMGEWLRVNGEAVYGTSPWLVYGEGPTKMESSGMFSESERLDYTAQDVRYTAKDGALYATLLAWPKEPVVLESLAGLYPGEVEKVSMLGSGELLDWKQTEKGLWVAPPKEKPCRHAFVLKIIRKQPF
ncbi:MAG: alpha-L-fucosidase [Oscillospiraceae bacterium]|nr:alpha-L-fucosidase [Oscillospiraceae bacterium]